MNTTPDVVSNAFEMLTALGIVLGGLLVIFYLMKRYMKKSVGDSKGQLIRVIASQYIGFKKNIALVEVPGTILVIGISNDSISLLTKIEEGADWAGIRPETSGYSPSFIDNLQRLAARFKSTDGGH